MSETKTVFARQQVIDSEVVLTRLERSPVTLHEADVAPRFVTGTAVLDLKTRVVRFGCGLPVQGGPGPVK